MNRASVAAQVGIDSTVPPARPVWRNTLWRRARSLTAEAAFQGLAALAAARPAAYDTGLVPRAVLPFCAMLEVSRPERFSQRKRLPRWIDGMIRDASASYLHGHPPEPGPTTALGLPRE